MKKRKAPRNFNMTSPRPPQDDREDMRSAAMQAEVMAAKEILAAGQGAEDVIEVARNAMWFVDQFWSSFSPYLPPVACKAGCSYCCYERVEVTGPEALYIASVIKGQAPPEVLDGLREDLAELDDVTRGMDPDARFAVLRPCAFLTDGKCSIYKGRPIACRIRHSLDVTPCRRGVENPGQVFGSVGHAVFYETGWGVIDGLKIVLADNGLDARPLEFTAAMRIALDDPEALDKYCRGEAVFEEAGAAPINPKSPAYKQMLVNNPRLRP